MYMGNFYSRFCRAKESTIEMSPSKESWLGRERREKEVGNEKDVVIIKHDTPSPIPYVEMPNGLFAVAL